MLGSLEVRSGGRPINLGWPKQRAVLAALLLTPNRPVAVSELVDAVWGEHAPASAAAGVQKYVSGLRALLGADRVLTRRPGYCVVVGEQELDLLRFDALAATGAAAMDRGDPAGALRDWDRAVALWRGRLLEDVELDESWRARHDSLTERHRAVQWGRIDARLALGDCEGVLPELRSLVAAEPLVERHWVQLIRALHGCGRTGEALAAYAEVRAALADQLGLDPGSELVAVQREILTAAASDQAAGPSWVTLCQLPSEVADFVGRRALLWAVLERFANARAELPLVVVSGPPGVGKTTFGVRVAHQLRQRYPDGQLYVHLGGASGAPREPAAAIAELLRAVGIDGRAIPGGLDERAAVLRARLADRRVLLFLDDAADAAQVLALLPGTATCGVLVTSRRLLASLPGAHHVRLDPLPGDEAVELLRRLAGARVDAEPDSAAEVVATCGGLPLAVRIAGARLAARPFASVAAMAGRLRDERRRLDELAADGLAVRPSLRLSYQGLSEQAGAVFRRLGLLGSLDFASWTLQALAAGGSRAGSHADIDPDADPDAVLEQLLAANLLTACPGPRYRLHDLLAVYARELAGADPDAERAVAQLIETALLIADGAHHRMPRRVSELAAEPLPPGLSGPAPAPAVEPSRWFDAERDLLRHLVAGCCAAGRPRHAVALADRLVHSLLRVAPDQAEQLYALVSAAADDAGERRLHWRAEFYRAQALHGSARMREAAERYARCVESFERLGAAPELAESLNLLSFCRRESGRLEEALALARRAMEVARSCCDAHSEANALRLAGDALTGLGAHDAAMTHLDEALAVANRLAEPYFQSHVLYSIARSASRAGRYERAVAACEQALPLLTALGDQAGVAWTRYAYSEALRGLGRQPAALEQAAMSRASFVALGDRRGEGAALRSLAAAHLAAGNPRQALRMAEIAMPMIRETGLGELAAATQSTLAAARAQLDGSPGT